MSCVHGVFHTVFSISFRDFFKKPKGHVIPLHSHKYDHVLVLYNGALRLECTRSNGDPVDSVFTAVDGIPARIQIDKGIEHKLTVEADNTSFSCCHSHRYADGSIAEKYQGHGDSYN